jgi:hypothetical protein
MGHAEIVGETISSKGFSNLQTLINIEANCLSFFAAVGNWLSVVSVTNTLVYYNGVLKVL